MILIAWNPLLRNDCIGTITEERTGCLVNGVGKMAQ